MDNPNLLFDIIDEASLVISCQTKFNPTDAEWDRWLTAVWAIEQEAGEVRLLVFTEGGHPTKPQLDRLLSLKRTDPPTAIVSPSSGLRFLASAMTFVNPTIQCFSPNDLVKAYDHIRLVQVHHQAAAAALERLRDQVAMLSFMA
jgi:hypothetical protein